MNRIYLLLCTLFAFSASPFAHADSISYDSRSGSTYNYDLNLSGPVDAFVAGDTLTLTGLSGVTGATLSSTASGFATISYTATSVTINVPAAYTYTGGSTTFPLFSVTVNPNDVLGTDKYTVNEANASYTGTAQGPVAAALTPEPSSLALLGTGILAVAGFSRRKGFKRLV